MAGTTPVTIVEHILLHHEGFHPLTVTDDPVHHQRVLKPGKANDKKKKKKKKKKNENKNQTIIKIGIEEKKEKEKNLLKSMCNLHMRIFILHS